MDKYEYKLRLEEINHCITSRDFDEAAYIADTVDWRRVKSVRTLCMISDVYKYVRRLDDAQAILTLAYERHPGGKSIVFSLCEICIKTNQLVLALEYYKEFVQLAPNDSGRFVLQYKLYAAQEVSLDERIEVLEQLKNQEHLEKWSYELAFLYHRTGQASKCVRECDELILYFGEGKYVRKAMELKMLHEPLTPAQQAKYENRSSTQQLDPIHDDDLEMAAASTEEMTPASEEPIPPAPQEQEVEEIRSVHTDVGEYNTMNLQKELADSMKGMWEVTPDNLIRPVAAEEETQSPAFVDTAQTIVMPQDIQEVKVPFGVEDDPMATRVMAELRKENLGESLPQMEELQQTHPIVLNEEPVVAAEPKVSRFLGMDYDGQMSFVVPERENVEKQITGQLRIEDILAEWERKKKEDEEQRAQEVRQLVLQHTGNILIDFDSMKKEGLLEKLENETEEFVFDDDIDLGETEELEEIEEVTEELEEIEEVTEEVEEEAEEEIFISEDEEEETFAMEETFTPEEIDESLEEYVEELTDEDGDDEDILELGDSEEEDEVVEEESEESESDEETEESEEAERAADAEDEKEPEVKESAEAVAAEAAAREEEESPAPRELTKEEKELYAAFIQNKKIQEELVNAVDSVSLAPYTGNLVITGEEGMDTLTLAKNIMKEIQTIDSNFSGKIAKISGTSLNTREPSEVVGKIESGALIIENAGRMNEEAADKLEKALQQENGGIIVVLSGGKKSIGKLLASNPKLADCFSARIDLEAMDNDTLVAFGKKYALSQEYAIDEMGLLALHTKIADNQTSDHAVTMYDVKKIMNDAIRNANRKNLGHFFDVVFGKRYDEEDMIVLKEKDFA